LKFYNRVNNPVKCLHYSTYVVYVLLDETKPGKYKFGPLSFDYEPFYVGEGQRIRPAKSKKSVSFESDISTAKEERIYQMDNDDVGTQIIGYYKDKNEAKFIEAKMLYLIPKKYLVNSNFPFLPESKRQLNVSECFVCKKERQKRIIKQAMSKLYYKKDTGMFYMLNNVNKYKTKLLKKIREQNNNNTLPLDIKIQLNEYQGYDRVLVDLSNDWHPKSLPRIIKMGKQMKIDHDQTKLLEEMIIISKQRRSLMDHHKKVWKGKY